MDNINITPIIKVTNNCNLRCKYCNYTLSNIKKGVMQENIVNKLINDYLNIQQDKYTFEWHGGEPTLLGIKFYENVIKIQKLYNNYSNKIKNTIQTNATLINQEWIDFFKENNFSVGVSFDGLPITHAKTRIYHNNESSHNDVVKNIQLIRKYLYNIGVLVVVSKYNVDKAEDIYNYLRNDLDISSFDFLPCIDKTMSNKNNYAIEPDLFTNFMIKIFKKWIYEDNPNVRIRFFNNIIDGILGKQPSVCNMSGKCYELITINYNGDVYNCDRFLEAKNFSLLNFKIGNIIKYKLNDIIQRKKFNKFCTDVKNIHYKCKNCNWLKICNGGCYFDRYRNNNITEFCDSRQYLFNIVNEFVQYHLNKQNNISVV